MSNERGAGEERRKHPTSNIQLRRKRSQKPVVRIQNENEREKLSATDPPAAESLRPEKGERKEDRIQKSGVRI